MDIGSNSDFDFVRVKKNQEPQGLEEQPSALTDTTNTETESNSKSNAEEKGNSDKNKDDTSSKNDDNKNTDSNSENEEVEITDIPIPNEEAAETVDAASASEENIKESELDKEITRAEETAVSINEEPFPDLTIEPSAHNLLNDTEYTYLLKRPRAGLLVNVEVNQAGTIENALIVQDDSNSSANPVVSLSGSNPGSPLNLDSFPLDVSSNNNTQFDSAVENSEYVSWGKWNGNVDISSGPNDTNPTNTPKDFYWLSAEAANLSSLRGEVSFSGAEGIGDINGNSINTLNGNFDVNFANGAIENGNLNLVSSNESWYINFTGSVTGVNASMNNLQGNVLGNNACNNCINGDIQGIFARPGDHFVGGFSLESTSSSTANGLFSLKQNP